LALICGFEAYLAITGLADYCLNRNQFSASKSMIYFPGHFQRNLFRSLYFGVLSIFYWSAGNISSFKRKAQEADAKQVLAEKQQAELEVQLATTKSAYLQQQINPHMLFNALNFVYGRVQEHSEDAAHCVWLLTEIMHFSLRENNEDGKINLADEIEQIRHLIEINAYRFPLGVSFTMRGDFNRFRIIPLILLTLTENIYKHGNLFVPNNLAVLHIEADSDGKLTFYSHNLKKPRNERYTRSALGLKNARIRLDAAYANSYQMQIYDQENFFELTLILYL
jgi:two-component system LytT family sensor kinase